MIQSKTESANQTAVPPPIDPFFTPAAPTHHQQAHVPYIPPPSRPLPAVPYQGYVYYADPPPPFLEPRQRQPIRHQPPPAPFIEGYAYIPHYHQQQPQYPPGYQPPAPTFSSYLPQPMPPPYVARHPLYPPLPQPANLNPFAYVPFAAHTRQATLWGAPQHSRARKQTSRFIAHPRPDLVAHK